MRLASRLQACDTLAGNGHQKLAPKHAGCKKMTPIFTTSLNRCIRRRKQDRAKLRHETITGNRCRFAQRVSSALGKRVQALCDWLRLSLFCYLQSHTPAIDYRSGRSGSHLSTPTTCVFVAFDQKRLDFSFIIESFFYCKLWCVLSLFLNKVLCMYVCMYVIYVAVIFTRCRELLSWNIDGNNNNSFWNRWINFNVLFIRSLQLI